ncbi:spermidine synthase [Opitutus terrae]|uniref:Integral membrane protein-like protein n=1 Tax=Opitutus terrae (strain DSM 11246 / JCM 15787 / PB90-1) TaxID=452637 RepID=B1ZMG1_OPITP|nr:fused MFS/spermidine synthase [Opitutus terrae]ACB73414.1 integral membrane protein-like protein [Opitutus terrae PB90-1]
MLPFAFSIFTGAFLLFAVQPLVGKYILPWFGGGPGVWNTCLLFFQTALLGGYAYAHLTSTRLTPRRQAILHLMLLAAALLLLPIVPGAQWKPQGDANPTWRILLLLTATVGLPYFVLSATGPLMQQWFSLVQAGRSPYRLYALSNVGSLLALLSYPFYFEREFTRQAQGQLWSVGLGVYALACVWCAWQLWRRAPAGAPARVAAGDSPPVSPLDRLLWFMLAAIASMLLLATTNKLCQDLAVIPFLWILPLSLYLLSFILCFDHPRWYSRTGFTALFVLGAFVDVHLLFAGHNARLVQQVLGYSTTLFAACMLCHGELFRLRPPPARLTSFYLLIAAGGATGGFVVAVLAPLTFDRYLELQIGLWLLSYLLAVLAYRHRSRAFAVGTALGAVLSVVVVPALKAAASRDVDPWTGFVEQVTSFGRSYWAYALLGAVVFLIGFVSRRGFVREWQASIAHFVMIFSIGLGGLMIVQIRRDSGDAIVTTRDFYGVLKVFDHNPGDADLHYRTLVHGVTSHGLQLMQPPQADWTTTYYTERSGIGLAVAHMNRDQRHLPRRIGLVGLGTGTVAMYGQSGDEVRIYEIDPQVERLARSHFSYLARTPAAVTVVLGDARLSMERELERGEEQQFDILALDAFSSDAIPAHLLTTEAFGIYLRHLKRNGVIAVHTSNRYLDLEPVVVNAAKHFKLGWAVISDNPPDKQWWVFRSTWILLTRDESLLTSDAVTEHTDTYVPSTRQAKLWTDDHASLYEVLK